MRALIFFAVNVFVAIASTANAAAQLPGKWDDPRAHAVRSHAKSPPRRSAARYTSSAAT